MIGGSQAAERLDLDALTVDDVRQGALRGRNVTVLGFARSGIALARFFADAGSAVTIYDVRPAVELGEAISALQGRPARLLLGPDVQPAVAWNGADLVATSPSINADYPTSEPRLRHDLTTLRSTVEKRQGTVAAIVSEADLVLRLCRAPTIGVTGTKGKTTTATLIAAILAADPGHPVLLGGNMGDPLIDRLMGVTAQSRVVIELSELQLPTLSRGPEVAVYTNVTSDHLDRHGSLSAYRAVKARLARLTRDRGGFLVLNAEDAFVGALEGDSSERAQTWPGRTISRYRSRGPSANGVGVVEGWIVAYPDVGRVMPVAELQLRGAHNLANACAAITVALHFGLGPDVIRRAAGAFRGVEHRLESVAEIDGVRFVNDSQGTQPDAVIAALRAFDPPLVLIAGGRDKGVDLTELGGVVAERAAAAVLIGESGPMLERLFRRAGLARIEQAPSLDAAVRRADEIARELADKADASIVSDAGLASPLATVLLSPAATSFDMFTDYAARGVAFKKAVADLAARSTRPPATRGRE